MNGVQKITIENLKNIDFKEVDLKGNNVIAIGGNGKGKSTFIDACFAEISDKPLKDDRRRGSVTVEYKDYTVQFNFSKKNQKGSLKVYDSSGGEMKKPATILKDFFGVQKFNIEDLLSDSPAKQVELIKKITGIDWADVDIEYKKLFEKRAEAKRDANFVDTKLTDRKIDESAPPVEFNIEEEKEALKEAEKKFSDYTGVLDKLKAKKERHKAITKEIEALQHESNVLEEDIQVGDSWVISNAKNYKDPKELRDSIISHQEENLKFNSNKEIIELQEKSRENWTLFDTLEDEMEQIKILKAKECEEANLPVTGMTFDGEQLYLDGQPFNSSTINHARKIIAQLELQVALMNEVKMARFEGSLLDENSMNQVRDWADKNGVQLFIEMVSRDGDLSLIVEEGGDGD